jgi:hypothetical protein
MVVVSSLMAAGPAGVLGQDGFGRSDNRDIDNGQRQIDRGNRAPNWRVMAD